MIAGKSALVPASILAAASAVSWAGSAIGAPHPPAYFHTSAVISANADVTDLHTRVTLGTKVIVLANHGQIARSVVVRIAASRNADLRATRVY